MRARIASFGAKPVPDTRGRIDLRWWREDEIKGPMLFHYIYK